nr:MAG TPA: hypothetical protein [Caudoviricetes sp.]
MHDKSILTIHLNHITITYFKLNILQYNLVFYIFLLYFNAIPYHYDYNICNTNS